MQDNPRIPDQRGPTVAHEENPPELAQDCPSCGEESCVSLSSEPGWGTATGQTVWQVSCDCGLAGPTTLSPEGATAQWRALSMGQLAAQALRVELAEVRKQVGELFKLCPPSSLIDKADQEAFFDDDTTTLDRIIAVCESLTAFTGMTEAIHE